MSKLGQLLGLLGLKRGLQASAPLSLPVRHAARVRLPGGIKYYPRYPNEKDPEITPSKLFRVERIRNLRKLSDKERNSLKIFNLFQYGVKNIAIVKNTPRNNAALWKIKHLVEIKPITFPYGEPTPNDINHTVLRETGECIVTKEIAVDVKRIEAFEKYKSNPAKITNQTIERNCRLKWNDPWSGGF
ncbi:mitochondrial ribosomal protein L30 [Arctopsyche grandis]|uniref:mitochondrial ribosomal protein L30 n=1 Tax=Arctopsyche grandis TaxID=121162 RepID=UPI00406D9987